jgi:hypothetical protein
MRGDQQAAGAAHTVFAGAVSAWCSASYIFICGSRWRRGAHAAYLHLLPFAVCGADSLLCAASPAPLLLPLQICITVFFCASVTLRGVTVVDANPYSLPFVCLWLANVAVGSGLILVVSAILVWVPVYDGRLANARLGGLCAVSYWRLGVHSCWYAVSLPASCSAPFSGVCMIGVRLGAWFHLRLAMRNLC